MDDANQVDVDGVDVYLRLEEDDMIYLHLVELVGNNLPIGDCDPSSSSNRK